MTRMVYFLYKIIASWRNRISIPLAVCYLQRALSIMRKIEDTMKGRWVKYVATGAMLAMLAMPAKPGAGFLRFVRFLAALQAVA